MTENGSDIAGSNLKLRGAFKDGEVFQPKKEPTIEQVFGNSAKSSLIKIPDEAITKNLSKVPVKVPNEILVKEKINPVLSDEIMPPDPCFIVETSNGKYLIIKGLLPVFSNKEIADDFVKLHEKRIKYDKPFVRSLMWNSLVSELRTASESQFGSALDFSEVWIDYKEGEKNKRILLRRKK
jgi:hypothetical protein